jgi:TolB-like protein
MGTVPDDPRMRECRWAGFGIGSSFPWHSLGIPLGRSCFAAYAAVVALRSEPGDDQLRYLFEDYVLDACRRELRQGDRLLAVEPKVFDFLAYIVANRDRVIGKDELIAAIWAGRIISESALTSCINSARNTLADSGKAQRLIKTLPRKGIRFVGAVKEKSNAIVPATQELAAPSDKSHPSLPDKPSIAVLPFASMSADSEQEYFSDGIVEEIITALSQVQWLFVIARNSSFTYKGQGADVQQVGRDLGVRYVLSGSVRKAANRVRIAAQLIDAETRANIWASHFEGTLDNIFDLQDQVTLSVVDAIVPKLTDAEIERTKRKPTEDLNAYDYYLRGLSALHRTTAGAAEEGLDFAYRAMALDPSFASAYGLALWGYHVRATLGRMIDRAREVPETARLARLAAQLGRDDALALCSAGRAMAYVVRDLDAGASLIDRALTLNPNLAVGWHWSGFVNIWLGEPETGLERVARAMRLSPRDFFAASMHNTMAHGHFFASRYNETCYWAVKALSDVPELHPALRILAASSAFAGDFERAHNAIERLRCVDPHLLVSNLRNVLGPYRRPDFIAKYEEGLRKAGLQE